MDIASLKESIKRYLLPLDPEKVILFGSYAYGIPGEESDIDLYIVSKEDFLPKNYSENIQHYKKYSRALKSLKQQYPIDIIVHTREMNRRFEEMESSFVREIITKGTRLI